VRNRPTRRPGDKTKPFLQIQPVDLVDNTVDIIVELRPVFLNTVIDCEQLFHRFTALHQRIDLESPRGQLRNHAVLRVLWQCAHFPPGIGKKPKRAGRGDFRFQLAQGTGRRIARVGKHLAAIGHHPRIQRLKILVGHIDLTADLHHIRHSSGQRLWNVRDGLGVCGDVLARRAVAPRCGIDKLAVLIPQRQGQAVNLWFGSDGERTHQRIELQEPPHPADEITDIIIAESVVQRQHRDAVRDLSEPGGRCRADLSGRPVRKNQVREAGLDCRVPLAQRIIVRIGNRRRIFLVIAPVVLGDF
jgi:hypothetical protein